MKNETLVSVVLDRSGSMSSIRTDMEGGFNTFISEQRKVKTDEVLVNLYQFDDRYDVEYENRPLALVPNLNLVPRGWTALYDALGKTINNVGERLSKLPENKRPARVLILVITDGGENSSKEFRREQIAEMIKLQQEKYNWQFVFLGANQDSFLVARSLNINTANAMTFAANASGVSCSYNAINDSLTSYRAGDEQGLKFRDADREAQRLAGAKN